MKQTRILDMFFLFYFTATLAFARILNVSADNHLELMEKPIGNACMFFIYLGIPCPFCGLTRSVVAFIHGDVIKSFSFHPLGAFLSITFFAFALAIVKAFVSKDPPIVESSIFMRIFVLIAVVCLLMWPFRFFPNLLSLEISQVPR